MSERIDASRPRTRGIAWCGMGALLLWLTLGDRVIVPLTTGGRGALAILGPIFVIAALGTLLLGADPAFTEVERARVRTLAGAVLPLNALLVILPIFAVLGGGADVRILMALLVPLALAGVFALVRRDSDAGHWMTVMFAAIVAHGGYATLQLFARLGILPAVGAEAIMAWDASAQRALSEDYVIVSRSTGLFVNSNVFGLWSALAVVLMVSFYSGWRLILGLSVALLGVYSSQSRTAWLALAVAAVVALAWHLYLGRIDKVVVPMVGLMVCGGVLYLTGAFSGLVEVGAQTRLASALGGQDENLLGRFDAWRAILKTLDAYPLGTWGPPQMIVGQSIDNQYLAMWAQGGLLLLVSYGWLFLAPFRMPVSATGGRPYAFAAFAMLALASWTMLAAEKPQLSALIWGGMIIGTLNGGKEARDYGEQ